MFDSSKEIDSLEKEFNYNEENWYYFSFLKKYLRPVKKVFSSIIIVKLFKEFKFYFLVNLVLAAVIIKISQDTALMFQSVVHDKNLEKTITFLENRDKILKLVGLYTISFLLGLTNSIIGEKIVNDSFYFIKKNTIEKFFNLKIEDKVSKKADVSMINEEESWTIAESWIHIPKHFVSGVAKILGLFANPKIRENVSKIGWKELSVSIVFIVFVGASNIYYANRSDKKREELRIPVRDEAYLTEKEVSKSILIDNMGLKNSYLKERDVVVNGLNEKFFDLTVSESFFKELIEFLASVFPFALLIAFKSSLRGYFFYAFSETLIAILYLIGGYRESKSLAFSLKIVDKFFLLPERDENISGLSLSGEKVRSISFNEVYFAYSNSERDVISNYSDHFVKSKLNKIEGRNGTGKSTILYLVLGTVEPQNGQIIVNLEDGRSFDINKDINLADWKENVVAYVSHESLFEQDKGSTGQKQIMNIDQAISDKGSVQVFLFDEADNSLDENNRIAFYKKVDELISDGKIVILISH